MADSQYAVFTGYGYGRLLTTHPEIKRHSSGQPSSPDANRLSFNSTPGSPMSPVNSGFGDIDDIKIPKSDIPKEFSAKQTDYILLFSSKDKEEATELYKDLQKMGDSYGFRGACFDDDTALGHDDINSESSLANELAKHCTKMVFYVTDNFITDFQTEVENDEPLMKTLMDEKKSHCFVPIFAKPKNRFEKLPFGLNAMNGLLGGDRYFETQVVKMLSSNDCKSSKERRARQLEDAKKQWIETRKAEIRKEREEKEEEDVKETENGTTNGDE